jgi:molybdate transport system substrate-binding protein
VIRRPALTLVALIVIGCTSSSAATSSRTSAAAVDLTVFGAASLRGVLDRVTSTYAAAVPGTRLTVSTDSSAALATQIAQGAPADLFLAADTANPQKLVDGGFAAGDAVVFARNELSVIVPNGNPAAIGSPADLARDGVKVIGAGDEVPITKYATQLLGNLAKQPGYPADFEAAYAANVVSREDNVKAVVAKVGLGEGDAGIVYATDAKASADVETVEIPEAANVMASYAGVVVKASANVDAARAFLTWVAGPPGRAILGEAGFLPPP